MRTTVTVDDELPADAQRLTGIEERSALIREALTRLVRSESARRLASLGGTELGLAAVPRRRPRPG